METLDQILLDEFRKHLGIKFEQATWDTAKNTEDKPVKRALTLADIRALHPFHWGYEFDEILNKRGGFDAIITNPPWEVFKPNAKEFFDDHSDLVSKNKMRIEDFEKEQAKLLRKPDIRGAWLEYLSRFPHVSVFFRSAAQYKNQISIVNGKRVGTDINLYKLFLEQSFNVLRSGGQCGIIIPSGVYTDLGSKQLRELLVSETAMDTLFGLSNERYIFEGVHHSWRICLLSFRKGGQTNSYMAGFRVNPREAIAPDQLDYFLHAGSQHVEIPVALMRRLSPDSFSVMEFKSATDVEIAEKMAVWPLLAERREGGWSVALANEFHIRNDSHLFKSKPGPGRLPLFTGKMFNQFCLTEEHSGYWINEKDGRRALLGKEPDVGQAMDYQGYRWVHRRIARNTDTRTMISTITPKSVFTEVNSTTIKVLETGISNSEMLFLCAVTNSFALDWFLRMKVSSTLNMFYIYQLPVPLLTASDPRFDLVVSHASRLVCTTAEYDDLAQEVGLRDHRDGASDPTERAELRAKLDGLIAHLYGLTEGEFAHILTTFPVVPQAVKDATLEAYRQFAPMAVDAEIGALLAQGEGPRVEFKSSARWDLKENKKNGELEKVIVKTVAGFLNSDGGTLLIGVDDAATVIGLQHDYQTVHKKSRDGYELFLHDLLLNAVGKDLTPQLHIAFHSIDGKEVCHVAIQASPRPVFIKDGVDEHLYIRSGNSTRRLTTKEAIDYCRSRWNPT